MNETTRNFLEVFSNQPAWQPPKVFFRLYYNNDGVPLCYTMEDLPGKYIEIDQATYARSPVNVRVIDGKIVEQRPTTITKKLVPSDTGIACDPQNVCVIVDCNKKHTKWNVKSYEHKD